MAHLERSSILLKPHERRTHSAAPLRPFTPDIPMPMEELRHRIVVDSAVKGYLDQWGKKFADSIGFKGNIREELFQRLPASGEGPIDSRDMDPKLLEFQNPSGFIFPVPKVEGFHDIIYRIECYGENFRPELQFRQETGSTHFIFLTGRNKTDYSAFSVAKDWPNGNGITVKTFPRSNQALRVNVSNTKEFVYGDIQRDGTISLADDQMLQWPQLQSYAGIYSAKDHSLKVLNGGVTVYPTDLGGREKVLRYFFHDEDISSLHIPLGVNFYRELNRYIPELPIDESLLQY